MSALLTLQHSAAAAYYYCMQKCATPISCILVQCCYCCRRRRQPFPHLTLPRSLDGHALSARLPTHQQQHSTNSVCAHTEIAFAGQQLDTGQNHDTTTAYIHFALFFALQPIFWPFVNCCAHFLSLLITIKAKVKVLYYSTRNDAEITLHYESNIIIINAMHLFFIHCKPLSFCRAALRFCHTFEIRQ